MTVRDKQELAAGDLGVVADAVSGDAFLHRGCAILRGTGEVRCFGQLKPSTTLDPFLASLRDVKAISYDNSLSGNAVCAALADGTARCASERKKSSEGRPADYEQDLSSLRDVREIVLDERHACARTGDGAVWCWGSNEDDRIAEHPMTFAATPVEIRLQDR